MKKRTHRRRVHHAARTSYREVTPVVWVRGWMFVVAFTLMLGLGAIMGGFFKAQLDLSTPQVAGAQTEAK